MSAPWGAGPRAETGCCGCRRWVDNHSAPQARSPRLAPPPPPPPPPPRPRRHYRNPAHQRRVRGAWAVAAGCDLLLFLVDASRELQRPDPRIHRLLADSCTAEGLGLDEAEWQPPPALLLLNKCDLVPRPQRAQLLPLSDRLRQLRQFDDVFFISAKDGGCRCCGGCDGGDGGGAGAPGWGRHPV